MPKKDAFLGIDLGTTGLRSILADERGNILLEGSSGIEECYISSPDESVSEQKAEVWKDALLKVLQKMLSGIGNYHLQAICVDSTSGTILPIDRAGKPLSHAMLHNDIRATREAQYINKNTGITVKPSFALSKILWVKNNNPALFEKTYKFLHAADYLKGIMAGDFETTDFSNAVKTGYDLFNYRWPDAISTVLGIPQEKLPLVAKTGEIIGELRKDIREEFGIREKVSIVAGATDSTTSFFSSGAASVGDWNTTLGTVLGIRGISKEYFKDPDGLLYAHRHPEEYWLPGAASNSGGEALRRFFSYDLKEYDQKIEKLPPTESLIYPLARKSEKFPFLNTGAYGFINMSVCDPVIMFKGFLEGLSYIERMIYEKISLIGYRINDNIYSMGGGAYSLPWLKIRANVLKKNICRAKVVETAFGAALIAAGGVFYKNLTEAIDRMVFLDKVVDPDDQLQEIYDENYHRFISECKKRGLF
jgi:xylulokinase